MIQKEKRAGVKKISLGADNVEKMTAPEGKRLIVWDKSITGFGIRVLPSGVKTFFYQGRVKGELVRITIGQFPAVKAQVARKKAQVLQGEIANGNDPRPEKKDSNAGTFGDLMSGYVELLKKRGKKSALAVKNQVTKDIEKAAPRLWKTSATEITLDHCLLIIGKLMDDEHPRQADKLRSYIRAAFAAAIKARGDVNAPRSLRLLNIKSNPARDITKVEGASGVKDRALTLAEFRAYWRRVKELPEPNRSLAMLHVLTGGQRQQQLARVTLNDIDRDTLSMKILDYKGRRPEPRLHIIPMTPKALEAIDTITGTGNFVYSCNGGLTPAHTNFLNDTVKRVRAQMQEAEELEKGPFTAGSIRATIETRLAAKPYRVGSDVLAQLLSHGMGGVQARHYQHHTFFDEKLEALMMLERMVEGIPEPIAEVIPMRRQA